MGGFGVIPGWKVKRELLRVVEQFGNAPRRLVEPLLRWNYDRTRWKHICLYGQAEIRFENFCVLLVYQPNEFAESLFETCDFMASKGLDSIFKCNV
jgi:hypothetical protein